MAEDNQDLDRNEAATAYKLEKARERGQVAKSSDVVSAVVFTVAVVYLAWEGWPAVSDLFRFEQALILQAGRADAAQLWPLVAHALRFSFAWAAPFLVALVCAAILANVLQTGPVLSFEPITADFDRLNPVNGFKRVFSLRTLFDALRASVKLVLLSAVAYYALKSQLPTLYSLAGLSPIGYLRNLVESVTGLGLKMATVLVVIALVDLIYTRREFAKKMRMSKREMKDEVKNREGDPRIRQRMRAVRNEMRKRSQSLRHTKNADVLLTNPTHVAVALRYEHGKMESPQVIAKGAGLLAAAMRHIAAKHGIPVVRSPQLARRIFKELDIQHFVPSSMFAEVARIIVWVYAMRERQTRSGAGGVAA